MSLESVFANPPPLVGAVSKEDFDKRSSNIVEYHLLLLWISYHNQTIYLLLDISNPLKIENENLEVFCGWNHMKDKEFINYVNESLSCFQKGAITVAVYLGQVSK